MGRNRAEASTTNTHGLLNQWCFAPGCLFLSPLSLSVSLSLCSALITPFSISALWFSAQSSPLEVSRPMCVITPGGLIVQAGHSGGGVVRVVQVHNIKDVL